jgi:uncharacterized protein HemY
MVAGRRREARGLDGYQNLLPPSVLQTSGNRRVSMALTALMFVILIISFALMFGLVRFTENIIATPELASAVDGTKIGDAKSGDAKNVS